MTDRVLTANDLRSGEVVFLGKGCWTPHIAHARIAGTNSDTQALEAHCASSVARNEIVEPYWIDIETGSNGINPVRYREQLRTLGPSIRTDLGKQAAGGNQRVSI